MNPYRIYTRRTMGLDNRVWRLMFLMILLPLGLLSYRLIDNDEKCTPFSFKIRTLSLHEDNVYYTGEVLSFTASIPSDNIDWDFGDNTAGTGGENVHHQFLREGRYPVKATGNSLCPFEREIIIQNPPVVVQSSDPVRGKIVGPKSFNVFTPQKFTYPGSAASYEWTVQNHPIYAERGRTVSFTFTLPGSYTIQVELDGDPKKRDYFDVLVTDEVKQKSVSSGNSDKVTQLVKPLDPQSLPPAEVVTPKTEKPDSTAARPPAPVIKKISNETFLLYLGKVQTKEMKIPDFIQYGIFETTPVRVNGKDGQTFGWLCNDICKEKSAKIHIGKKKVAKLESAVLQRINGLVSMIEVNYKWER